LLILLKDRRGTTNILQAVAKVAEMMADELSAIPALHVANLLFILIILDPFVPNNFSNTSPLFKKKSLFLTIDYQWPPGLRPLDAGWADTCALE
jgi:hypothetical protein